MKEGEEAGPGAFVADGHSGSALYVDFGRVSCTYFIRMLPISATKESQKTSRHYTECHLPPRRRTRIHHIDGNAPQPFFSTTSASSSPCSFHVSPCSFHVGNLGGVLASDRASMDDLAFTIRIRRKGIEAAMMATADSTVPQITSSLS